MRRSEIDIIMDILEAARRGATKTGIVYNANLNFKRADRYLDVLQRMGLAKRSSNYYHITEQGINYLEKIKEINIFSRRSAKFP